jgi:serine/threonine protein kinase
VSTGDLKKSDARARRPSTQRDPFTDGVSDHTMVDDEAPLFLELSEDPENPAATVSAHLDQADYDAILSEAAAPHKEARRDTVVPIDDLFLRGNDASLTKSVELQKTEPQAEPTEVHAMVSADFAEADQETEIEDVEEFVLELKVRGDSVQAEPEPVPQSVLTELALPANFVASAEGVAQFGPYLLLKKIATAQTSEIRLAFRMEGDLFSHACVVKRLSGENLRHQDRRQMFADESRLGAFLVHPNVVRQYESGAHDSVPFIAMELVDGCNLANFVNWYAEPQLPLTISLEIARQIAAGLHYAHQVKADNGDSLQIIHRDVSPQNILIDRDGTVKLADFGMAKFDGRAYSTDVWLPKNEARYLAPEQLRRQPLTHRVDIFALGVVMVELCSGRALFARNAFKIPNIETHVREILAQGSTRLPAGLTELLVRMTAEDPQKRPASAQEVELLLEMIQETLVASESLELLAEELMRPHLSPISEVIQEFFHFSHEWTDPQMIQTLQESDEFEQMGLAASQALRLLATSRPTSPALPSFFPSTSDFVMLAEQEQLRNSAENFAPLMDMRPPAPAAIEPIRRGVPAMPSPTSKSAAIVEDLSPSGSMPTLKPSQNISASSPTPSLGVRPSQAPLRHAVSRSPGLEVPAWFVVTMVLCTVGLSAGLYVFLRSSGLSF